MKKTDIQMAILISVAAVIAVVLSVPYISGVMMVLINDIGWLPISGIFIGFAGVFYGVRRIGNLFMNTKYRY